MSRTYAFFRLLTKSWAAWLVVLIGLTLFCGTLGFVEQYPHMTWLSAVYHSIQLFTLGESLETGPVPVELEMARWLGFAVWASAVFAVAVGLFQQRLVSILVALLARNHVIVAGLGDPEENGDQLVRQLREQGKDVVVIEPDPNHPGISQCRDAGGIVLVGSPTKPNQLHRARLRRASDLITFFLTDRENVQIAATAYQLLQKNAAVTPAEDWRHETPFTQESAGKIRCAVQVTEPGLLEVLHDHELYRNPHDNLILHVFNIHEVTSRVMLREATRHIRQNPARKVMILGSGEEKRLGETLLLRAVKDWWIEHCVKMREAGRPQLQLEVDIFDEDVAGWIQELKRRYPMLRDVCRIRGHECAPARSGFHCTDRWNGVAGESYDAIFVCLADETQAIVQAYALREALGKENEATPIVVRLPEKSAGFGMLLSRPAAGGLGPNMIPVGMRDRVFDIMTALNPEIEMLAQVLHQDYLYLTQAKIQSALQAGNHLEAERLQQKEAFASWDELKPEYRAANRDLARRASKYLDVPQPGGGTRRFYLEFVPDELIDPLADYRLSATGPASEVGQLARAEHEQWCRAQKAAGWKPGGTTADARRKRTPYLVPWDELDDAMKGYNRHIIQRLPFVFAKADYRIVAE